MLRLIVRKMRNDVELVSDVVRILSRLPGRATQTVDAFGTSRTDISTFVICFVRANYAASVVEMMAIREI